MNPNGEVPTRQMEENNKSLLTTKRFAAVLKGIRMDLMLFLSVLLAAVTSSFSCHQHTLPDTIETRVAYSDVVLAVRIAKATKFDDIGRTYDVDADVYCVYKRPAGFPLSSSVTIQQVGPDADNCFTSNLTTRVEYIAFLRYFPEKNQLIPADSQKLMSPYNMRYLASVCDTKLEIPQGVAIVEDRCPQPEGRSDCRRLYAPTQRPESTPVSGTNMRAPSLVVLLISSLLVAF